MTATRLDGITRIDPLGEIIAATQVRTGRGIAASVGELIRTERLEFGTILPSIRTLAEGLHVSATTVSEAWQVLGSQGLIRTSGRNGTVVLRAREVQLSGHRRRAMWMTGVYGTDLSSGTPDAALLPSISGALRAISSTASVSNYSEGATLDALEQVIRARWAGVVEAEEIMITDGAFDAIDRILRERLRAGDRVIVEQPTLPSLLDAIEAGGGIIVPIPMDKDGMRPDALADAMALRPTLLVFQPRAQNPTGISTTPERMKQLAAVIAGTRILAIEDDHMGDAASAERVSMSRFVPDQVVYIESFSKAYGPDLRLAAVGAPAQVLREVARRRQLGPAWSSRILQSLMHELLVDEETQVAVTHARRTYFDRRRALQHAVEARGLCTTGTEGLNMWVQVPNETRALRLLAEADIGAAPGTPFFPGNPTGPFIRVTCAALDEKRAPAVARLIADAEF